ncbi:hypothetical protein [Streptomyces sp. NPDC093589]|uniref:hypothetical protein n=1 Tax=Streptomyces sp. NPDC093589 TaxID=3366043 RepID=UPI00380670F4
MTTQGDQAPTRGDEAEVERDYAVLVDYIGRLRQGLREGHYAYALDKALQAREVLDDLLFDLRRSDLPGVRPGAR